ncbi:MAG: TIGR03620 family F420-dependent LLM class oxidoreductase [Acidimicrobiia bacterium]
MITGTGIWAAPLRYGDPGEIAEAAAELESSGCTALWIPDVGDDVFGAVDRLLTATSTMTVATGIMNIWLHTPEATNAWWAGLSADRRSRVLLGLGVGHDVMVGEAWGAPLATMRGFLDALAVPEQQLCLAALGPKMLELARDRTAGAHPYLVTPEQTATARVALGPNALLAPEQGVVLATDATSARGIVREELTLYRTLPNHTNNWRRQCFTEDDIDSLSDRLVDALFVWGDVDAVAQRVAQHRAAGADHVCLQVAPARRMHRDAWKALAGI